MLVRAITDAEISELACLARDHDVAPIFLRGEAIAHPQSAVSRCFQRLADATFEEMRSLQSEALKAAIGEIPEDCLFLLGSRRSDDRDAYLREVADLYVRVHVSAEVADIRHAVLPEQHEDRVLAKYPELADCFDKDDLLVLDDRFELRPLGVRYNDHVLQFHQFLRRGYRGSPNRDLIGALGVHSGRPHLTKLAIAIDRSRLMPLAAYRDIVELDHWWGPKFEEQRLDDPTFAGMTVINRRAGTILERLFDPVERTEFFWSNPGQVKTLEIEELSRSDASIQLFVLNRYIHAERDTSMRAFRHLDGAVKLYRANDYPRRLGAKLSDRPKAFRKPKLFRLDGSFTTDQVIGIISLFYRSNEMIIEYFNPAEFHDVFGKWNVPWSEED